VKVASINIAVWRPTCCAVKLDRKKKKETIVELVGKTLLESGDGPRLIVY
jgi:hypothetical protein